MPFTLAHPAIIIPLARAKSRAVSATALIIGSMVPDFEYFFRLKVRSDVSHTFSGAFLFDLPVGVALYLLFMLIIRDALVHNLPPRLAAKFGETVAMHPLSFIRRLPAIVLCVLVGVFSHIGWDSFTHEHGFFVERIEALQQQVSFCDESWPAYKVLQHASSLVGIAIIAIFLARLPAQKARRKSSRLYWPLVGTATFLTPLLKYILSGDVSLGDLIVSSIAGLLYGLTAGGAIVSVKGNKPSDNKLQSETGT